MAAAKIPVRSTQTGDRQLDEIQRLAQEVAQRANDCPFFTGVEKQGVAFAAGVDQVIDHGLGRRPRGVLVLRDYGANVCTGVGESTTQPNDLTRQIKLRSPVACLVDLWVFG